MYELASIIPPPSNPLKQTRGSRNAFPFTVQLQKPRTTQFVRSFVPNTQSFKSLINRLPLTSLNTPTVSQHLGSDPSGVFKMKKKMYNRINKTKENLSGLFPL